MLYAIIPFYLFDIVIPCSKKNNNNKEFFLYLYILLFTFVSYLLGRLLQHFGKGLWMETSLKIWHINILMFY